MMLVLHFPLTYLFNYLLIGTRILAYISSETIERRREALRRSFSEREEQKLQSKDDLLPSNTDIRANGENPASVSYLSNRSNDRTHSVVSSDDNILSAASNIEGRKDDSSYYKTLSSKDIPAAILVDLDQELRDAASVGSLERVIRKIKGLKVDGADTDDKTPLICASSEGHLPVVEFLVGKGANVDHLDKVLIAIYFLYLHHITVYILRSKHNILYYIL